ncbi:MAG: EAL domain-containing protein [Spirochaetota bacterium]
MDVKDNVWDTYLQDYSNHLSAIAIVLAVLLFIASPLSALTGNAVFAVTNFVLASLVLCSYLLRKLTGAWIVVVTIVASGFTLSMMSLLSSALFGTAETIIIIAHFILVFFLPRRHSFAIGLLSILFFLAVGWFVSQGVIVVPQSALERQTNFFQWILHAFALFGFIVIAVTLIDRMRSHLMNSIKDLVLRNQKITQIAFFDPVTGLANKSRFLTRIQEDIDTGACTEGIVVFLEIRKYRLTKVLYGPDVAESQLKAMALMLQQYAGSDYIARTDGGEFAVWSPHRTVEEITSFVTDNRIGARVLLESHAPGLPIEIDTAAARFPEDGSTLEECMLNAELALHDSFQSTRGIRWFAPRMKESLLYAEAVEQSVEQALLNNEFRFVFQPQFDLTSRKVVGAEVLCRWSSAELGTVSPGVFIPALTRKALITKFTTESLRSVLTNVDRIDAKYGPDATVSFNVSPAALLSEGFVHFALDIVRQSSIDPKRIIFEITEDLFIEELEVVVSIIRDLYTHGVRTSLDDFGTGYSSLSYVGALPISEIKADKSFVSTIAHDQKSLSLFRSLCSIADAFGHNFVAEGVENAAQLSAIQTTSCSIVQGFLFGRPEPL